MTRLLALTAAVVLAVPGVAGCGAADDPTPGLYSLRMMVPNSPGGGYDLTARTAVRIMEDEDITGRVEVFNVIGDSGAVAMARLMNEVGNDDLMMTMGLGVVGATYTFDTGVRASDATALAKLIEDPGAIVVPADSPFATVGDFVAAWRADPAAVTIGGGSAPGGPDHLFAMRLAEAVGIDPVSVDYVTHDGGGDLLAALFSDEVSVSTSSPGEFLAQIDAGQLRVLAVSSGDAVPGIDAPTLRASGIDLTFANWRGVLAPPGISASSRESMIRLLTELHDTRRWQEALRDNGWTDSFVTGADFERFLDDQDDRVSTTLARLGLI